MTIPTLLLSALVFPSVAHAEKLDGFADPEVQPTAPDIKVPDPEEDAKSYAGVGSYTSYASKGVTEAGGSLALSIGSGTTYFGADPTIGYFPWNNVELSAILGTQVVSVEGVSSQRYSLLVEPSLHQPINDAVFIFGGIGTGVALADNLSPDGTMDIGYAVVPRAGVQFLVGRSGLMNVGLRYNFIFSDIETDVNGLQGQTVMAFTNALDMQVGYTVMF